jgi:hypothetical protein
VVVTSLFAMNLLFTGGCPVSLPPDSVSNQGGFLGSGYENYPIVPSSFYTNCSKDSAMRFSVKCRNETSDMLRKEIYAVIGSMMVNRSI